MYFYLKKWCNIINTLVTLLQLILTATFEFSILSFVLVRFFNERRTVPTRYFLDIMVQGLTTYYYRSEQHD